MKTLVLGLGNPLLGDDAVGLKVVAAVRERVAAREDVEVAAGRGGRAATDGAPDRLRPRDPGRRDRERRRPWRDPPDGPGRDPDTAHRDRPRHRPARSALALGRSLGLPMPSAVRVIAIEAVERAGVSARHDAGSGCGLEPAVVAVLEELGPQLSVTSATDPGGRARGRARRRSRRLATRIGEAACGGRCWPWPAGTLAVDCCSGIWPVFKTLAHLDIADRRPDRDDRQHDRQRPAARLRRPRRQRLAQAADRRRASPSRARSPWRRWRSRSYLLLGTLVLLDERGVGGLPPVRHRSRRQPLAPARRLHDRAVPVGRLSRLLRCRRCSSRRSTSRRPRSRRSSRSCRSAWRPPSPRSCPPRASRAGSAASSGVHCAGRLRALHRSSPCRPSRAPSTRRSSSCSPDLLLSRSAAPWIVRGGGHFALIAGGCLSLLPAGQASDRWGARRLLVFANLTTALVLGLLLLRARRVHARSPGRDGGGRVQRDPQHRRRRRGQPAAAGPGQRRERAADGPAVVRRRPRAGGRRRPGRSGPRRNADRGARLVHAARAARLRRAPARAAEARAGASRVARSDDLEAQRILRTYKRRVLLGRARLPLADGRSARGSGLRLPPLLPQRAELAARGKRRSRPRR